MEEKDKATLDIKNAVAEARHLGEPDPHIAAERTFGMLGPEAVRELARRAWAYEIRYRWRHERTAPAESGQRTSVLERAYAIDGSNVKERWRYLRDCSVIQVRAIKNSYAARKEENAEMERRFARLERTMLDKNAAVVSDLGEETVAEILDGPPSQARMAA